MLKLISGDLFDSKAKYIAHQCNCLTYRAAHLAKDVFARYPYADIYSPRHKIVVNDNGEKEIVWSQDVPGNIIVRGNGKDQRYVVAILGQYYPGSPKNTDSMLDGTQARQKYFHSALWKLTKIRNLESVAFPYCIGCGAAGGDWVVYNKIIENFAKYLNGKADIFIYKNY